MIADKIYSRGVLVLKETKFIPLSIWAQRLHDGNNASRGEWGCAVKGWTRRRNNGLGGTKRKGKTPEKGEGCGRGMQVGGKGI